MALDCRTEYFYMFPHTQMSISTCFSYFPLRGIWGHHVKQNEAHPFIDIGHVDNAAS